MRIKRQEQERRLRIMAKAKVDMLKGTYVWPDGRDSITKAGKPIVSQRELLRIGGYSENYRDNAGAVFENPFFLAKFRTEMARRESQEAGRATLGTPQPGRLTKISNMLLDELENRLVNDSSSFTHAQILLAAREYRIAAQQNEITPPTESARHDKMQQFNSFIQNTLTVMNDNERERLVDTAADAAEHRVTELQKMIDHANLVEEDSADIIIDAEISPVPD